MFEIDQVKNIYSYYFLSFQFLNYCPYCSRILISNITSIYSSVNTMAIPPIHAKSEIVIPPAVFPNPHKYHCNYIHKPSSSIFPRQDHLGISAVYTPFYITWTPCHWSSVHKYEAPSGSCLFLQHISVAGKSEIGVSVQSWGNTVIRNKVSSCFFYYCDCSL